MAGLLFFGRLGCPLLEPEEARYAEIPREMRAEGRFLVPVLHGQPYHHKPPLLYWLVMAGYGLFGVHDWAARLVPGTAGLLTVLVTYFWGRATVGRRAAFAGALILCLSARFVYFARMLTFDGLLALGVTAALAAAHTALQGPRLRWRWWLASAGLCGLGLLTKGPVALVLLLVPVLSFQALDRRAPRAGWRGWLAYGGLALGVAGPWYLLVGLRDPRFLADFFWTHHVVRFLTPIDHAKPCWFYLPGLLTGMLPWTLLVPPFLRFLGRRAPEEAGHRPGALGFFLLAFLVCLGFFSASGCKRAGYILPAFPPLALALGSYLATAPARRWLVPGAALAGATFAVLLLALHLALPGYSRKFSLRGQVRRHFALAQDHRLPVACYPHGWDSVSFYLRRDDVRVYSPAGKGALAADLEERPEVLCFVKADHPGGKPLSDFRAALPAGFEFVPLGRPGWVTAGLVRRRGAGSATRLARQ